MPSSGNIFLVKKSESVQDLISIITPLYNSADYIKKTAASIFSQDYPHWEWIIVDDCSKDKSWDIVSSFKDSRVRTFKNSENKGVVGTRNFALQKTEGSYIAFLDSDDYWAPEKLSKQLYFMKERDICLSFHSYQKFYNNGRMGQIVPATSSVNYQKMLSSNYIGCLTSMVKKEVIGSLEMVEGYKGREDWIFWLSILKDTKSQGYSLPDVLGYYRISEDSLSSKKFEMVKEQYRVYREVLKMNYFETLYYTLRYLSIGFRKYIR